MTPTQRQAIKRALALLESAHVSTDLIWERNDCCEALSAALAEQADDKAVNIAPLSDEPNWRHPKIQGLIGSEARLRIQIDLIWRILEDPNQEFGPSDMEYWDTLHDKLKSTLAAHGIKGD